MDIKKPIVIGGGIMGAGIGQLCAQKGFDVTVTDVSDDVIDKAKNKITKGLERRIEKGKITQEDMDSVLTKISWTTDLSQAADSDFVVEAALEDINLKKEIFQTLDSVCSPETILASNTTALSVSDIGAATQRPDKVIGMHFFNPAVIMKLVEIIRGLATSDETFKTTWHLAIKFGKTPAEANDYPGFIANRILMPMINEAIYCLYHGVGTREDIDTVMKLGANHPMGPLALADLIGLDTCLAIMDTLSDGFKDSKYRSCPLLRKYVEAGWLGRKTGRGFYEYK